MTPRERVIAALTFNNPNRPPRDLWALPYVSLFQKDQFDDLVQKYPMDIGASQLSPGWDNKVVDAAAKAGRYVGDWGSVWQVGEPGVIGEVVAPVLADWSKLDSFKPPWDLSGYKLDTFPVSYRKFFTVIQRISYMKNILPLLCQFSILHTGSVSL